eukprot:7578001-Pyramimonas_sp.AAC.1
MGGLRGLKASTPRNVTLNFVQADQALSYTQNTIPNELPDPRERNLRQVRLGPAGPNVQDGLAIC